MKKLVIELGDTTQDLQVAIGVAEGGSETLYDAIQMTHRSGRDFGSLRGVQFFLETCPYGAAMVCRVSFAAATLDILLDPLNSTHAANLDALSKQPTVPVYQYASEPNGGRSLIRRQFVTQAVLVRRGIATALAQALVYDARIGGVSWENVVEWYRNSDVSLPDEAEAEGMAG